MGQPKLLMPWRGSTVLETVLEAWAASRVDQTVVVVRPGCERLVDIGHRAGAAVVVPETTPTEMKISVGYGLEYVTSHFRPSSSDVWLLCPADIPDLSVHTIDQLLDECRIQPGRIVAPVHRGRRGHPVAFPWPLVADVACLDARQGINSLLSRHRVWEMKVDDPVVLDDMDTPDDYDRLTKGC